VPGSSLNWAGRIHLSFLRRMVKRCTVAVRFSEVFFDRIIVGVKMNQRHLSVYILACPKFRQRHTVISSYYNRNGSAFKECSHLRMHLVKSLLHIPRHSRKIAVRSEEHTS